jgi:hypothetical protein
LHIFDHLDDARTPPNKICHDVGLLTRFQKYAISHYQKFFPANYMICDAPISLLPSGRRIRAFDRGLLQCSSGNFGEPLGHVIFFSVAHI